MKRSGQVLLVLMGVTGATAAGSYLQPRDQCVVQRDGTTQKSLPSPQSLNPAQDATAQPCQPRRSSGSSWYWGPRSSGSSSRSRSAPSANVVAPTQSRTTTTRTTQAPTTSRGGFGTTGTRMSSSTGS